MHYRLPNVSSPDCDYACCAKACLQEYRCSSFTYNNSTRNCHRNEFMIETLDPDYTYVY